MNLDVNLNNIVGTTIAVQFVFFGWRIVREIGVGDKESKIATWRAWLPWPDRVNLISLFAVTASCIVAPIVIGHFTAISRAVLVGATVLWMCHPISVAYHYELFSGGRHLVYGDPSKWPLVTKSERRMVTASVLLAIVAGLGAWLIIESG